MNLFAIINGLNAFCEGYNVASSVKDFACDKTLPEQDITIYFNILRYVISKYPKKFYSSILDLYECAVKDVQFQLTNNFAIDSLFNEFARQGGIAIAKNNLTEPVKMLIGNIIDRDFNEMQNCLQNDYELSAHRDIQTIMLNLTPIIKAKLKISIFKTA